MRIKDHWYGFWAWTMLRSRKSNAGRSQVRFRNADEVSSYVDQELSSALPDDWTYRQISDLEWVIAPKTLSPHSLEDDYRLEVSGDLGSFMVYFGNSAGGCDCIVHPMLTAVVLRSSALTNHSLGRALNRMIANREFYRLNMWTLT